MPFQPMIQFIRQLSRTFHSTMYAGINSQIDPQHISFMRQLQKEMNESRLHTPLEELKTAVIDFETSGFHPANGDQILSIGAIHMNGPVIEDKTFYSLVQSEIPIRQEILALTSLNEHDLKNAPALFEVLTSFYRFCEGRILVAHHANHEKHFLAKAHEEVFKKAQHYRIFDTSFFIRFIDFTLSGTPLETCCQACHVEVKNRHHALGDAKMTAFLWQHILKKGKEKGCKTLGDLYEMVARGE